jgi:hypothetical protein
MTAQGVAKPSLDGLNRVISAEALKHYCAVCFAEERLSRCTACRTIYYCSPQCQKEDWTTHATLCKNKELRSKWKAAFATLVGQTCFEDGERKTAISDMQLLENWSKKALCSSGYLKILVESIEKEQYTKQREAFNFRLVALVDALRCADGQSIDVDLTFMFIYEMNGLSCMLKVLAEHHQLHFSQKLSTIRFLRLTAAQPKLQPALIDQVSTTILPLTSLIIARSESTDVAAELGIVLASILYGASSPTEYTQLQITYGNSLDLKLWMDVAFGDSSWSTNMDMGAVELLLALLADPDDTEAGIRSTFIQYFVLPYPDLLRSMIFGFLDLLIVPKSTFYAAGLQALLLLFSKPEIVDTAMSNLWLMSDLVGENDDEEEPVVGEESPLRQMLLFFRSEPIIQLTYFRVHTHIAILKIFQLVMNSQYCNRSFIEAAVGFGFLVDQLDYAQRRYQAGLAEAQKFKESHRLVQKKVGNQEEMEAIVALISALKNRLSQLPEDIGLNE